MKKVYSGNRVIGTDSYEWMALRFRTDKSGGVIFFVSKNGEYFLCKDIHCKSFSDSAALKEIVLTESKKRLDSDFDKFMGRHPEFKGVLGIESKNSGMPEIMKQADFRLL